MSRVCPTFEFVRRGSVFSPLSGAILQIDGRTPPEFQLRREGNLVASICGKKAPPRGLRMPVAASDDYVKGCVKNTENDWVRPRSEIKCRCSRAPDAMEGA